MKKLFGERQKKVAKQMLGIEDRRKRPRLKAIKDGTMVLEKMKFQSCLRKMMSTHLARGST